MQAVILAAGRGRRMEPLSTVTPKPMLPVGDRPLAAHVADAAVAAGANELVFVVGYGADHFRSYFGSEYGGVPVRYAVQSSPAGTADAVRTAREHVDGRFAVLNGDNLFDPESVAELFECDAAVAAHRVSDPSEYGVLTTDGDDVTGIVEKPENPPSTLANAGAYVFPASVREDLDVEPSERGERELTDVLAGLVDQREVTVVETERWLDVARPPDLLAANELVLSTNASVGGAENAVFEGDGSVGAESADGGTLSANGAGTVRVAPDATVGHDANLTGAVLLAGDATVGADAEVRGPAVIGPGAHVGAGSSLEAVVMLDGASVGERVRVRGAVLGPDCVLSDESRVAGVSGETRASAAAVVGAVTSLSGGLRYR